jgi:hypothetical protein
MEVIHSLEIDSINAHKLCGREHHRVEQELLHLTTDGYL